MKYCTFLLLFVLLFNCDNKPIIQLPEIENAEITEVLDVSPAYIFYDETQLDSSLLNSKNLINTSNWLVNVDKRLTLRQAIPHIKVLQDKRRNAQMHKNENAKNYFTCNDTSIGNISFIEFTGVNYIFSDKKIDAKTNFTINDISRYKNIPEDSTSWFKLLSGKHNRNFDIKFGFKDDMYIITSEHSDFFNSEVKKSIFFEYLNYRINNPLLSNFSTFNLHFHESISFQEYIWIKTNLYHLKFKNHFIKKDEFIY